MQLAIPSDSPGGLDAAISEHFGHCDSFTLVSVDDGQVGEVRVVANGEHEHGGCMAPVMALKAQNVDVLLAGGMGMRPLAGFQQVGIAVHYKEDARTVGEAVKLFIQGKCRQFGEAQTCSGGGGHCGGHGHEHEEPVQRPAIEGKADVREGRVVTLEFEVRDKQGNTVASSKTEGPLLYLQGSGNLVGLERAIAGLEAGARVTAEVAAAEAYGPRDEQRMVEVPLENLPENVSVGDMLAGRAPNGQAIPLLVRELRAASAVLDANHPLAGMDLIFDVTVVRVEAATADEIQHGHVHG